jgi:hemolysin activation/secretion protein
VDIYEICKVIDQNYAEKGFFLARSYPPPQEIRDGVLVIKILEGRIGNIRVEGNRHYTSEFILRYFKPFCQLPMHYDRLLKALLLLNEFSDLSVGVLFEKGEEVGTADLIIRVDDDLPNHMYINENNYGRDLTTSTQLGGRIDIGNFLIQGDTFSVAEVFGFPFNALYFTDVIYNVPVNARGTFLEFSYLYSKFKIQELEELDLKGQSAIATIKFLQALKRTKTLAIDFFAYFDYKQIRNYELHHRIAFDKLRVVSAGVSVDHFNSIQGRDYLNVQFSAGIPDFLGGMKAVTNESSRIGGGGRFVQFNLDYDHLQRLFRDFILYFHVSGQWSPSKLTLPQQIFIGGSNTVRGYPMSVALGDSGYYANWELRFPVPFLADRRFFKTNKIWRDVVQVVGFFDTGATFYNKGSDTYISGAGVGVRVFGPFSLSLSLDVGYPLTRHDLSSGPVAYIRVTAQPF